MTESARCPKCGFERRPEAQECPACGIVYARFDPERAAHRRLAAAGGFPDPTRPAAGFDPYRAPAAAVSDVRRSVPASELARRFTRLAAAILDGLIYVAVVFVAMVPLLIGDLSDEASSGLLSAGFMLLMLGGLLGLLIANLYYLHRDGQSLGKKALRIRIVRTSDERATLGRIFLLRMLVPGVIGAVPLVGPFFSLADALFIFGDQRRCIHDYLADTKVVLA